MKYRYDKLQILRTFPIAAMEGKLLNEFSPFSIDGFNRAGWYIQNNKNN